MSRHIMTRHVRHSLMPVIQTNAKNIFLMQQSVKSTQFNPTSFFAKNNRIRIE